MGFRERTRGENGFGFGLVFCLQMVEEALKKGMKLSVCVSVCTKKINKREESNKHAVVCERDGGFCFVLFCLRARQVKI